MVALAMFSVTACKKEEEKEVQAPIDNVNSLIDKYASEGGTNTVSDEEDSDDEGSKAVNVTDETESKDKENDTITQSDENDSEGDKIDYDKLDEALMNEIIANGGSSTSGDEIINNQNPSNNGYLVGMAGIYYSIEGFEFNSENQGIRVYTANDMLEAVEIYAYKDSTGTFSSTAIINAYEAKFLSSYGNYMAKNTYTNKNGITFNRYYYNESNKINSHVLIEVFLYSDGVDTIYAAVAVNSALGSVTEDGYGFIDSIRFQ